MRAVVQRVSRAQVTVGAEVVGEIGRGLLVLLGVTHADTEADADYLAEMKAQRLLQHETQQATSLRCYACTAVGLLCSNCRRTNCRIPPLA